MVNVELTTLNLEKAHTKARSLESQWESHWSHLLLLVHHMPLSICLWVLSLFMYETNVPRCKLIGCFSTCGTRDRFWRLKFIVVILTNPMHRSRTERNPIICRFLHIHRPLLTLLVRDVHEQGLLHLDHSCELLCELGLGLRSRGVSWIQQCCPQQGATMNVELTISNRGKTQVLCVIMRVVFVIWSHLLTPTCSSYHYWTIYEQVGSKWPLSNLNQSSRCELIGCFVQVALHLRFKIQIHGGDFKKSMYTMH